LQDNEDLSVADSQTLINGIKTKLNDMHTHIKEVKLKAEEDEKDETTTRVLDRLKAHQQKSENLRVALRAATLKVKLNLDKRYEKEKNALFEGNTEVRNRILAQTKLDTIKQSSMLTEGLRRSRAVLTGQIDRSQAALKELDDANKMIDQGVQLHRNYSATVRTGKGYTTKLKRREVTDRLLIFFGLLVFLLVVLYIAKTRLRFRLLGYFFGE